MLGNFRADLDRYPARGLLRRAGLVLITNELQIVLLYRVGRWMYLRRRRAIARICRYVQNVLLAADIHYAADIGPGLRIKHGFGIVIGEGVVIGRHATIFNGVTFGTKSPVDPDYPTAGDFVFVGTGAKILGRIHVGDRAIIAANSVVLRNVPSGSVAAGIPATVRREHTWDVSTI